MPKRTRRKRPRRKRSSISAAGCIENCTLVGLVSLETFVVVLEMMEVASSTLVVETEEFVSVASGTEAPAQP